MPLTTHTQVFEALERVYGVLNKEYLYQGQFERLEQGNTDFNAFVAEFYRLVAPLRRDENSLLNSFVVSCPRLCNVTLSAVRMNPSTISSNSAAGSTTI